MSDYGGDCNENCSCKSKIEMPTMINIKYFDNKMPKIEMFDIGDWIDLRVRDIKDEKNRSTYDKAEGLFRHFDDAFLKIYLGVAMKLPKGYEAHVAPRGSTFKHTGLIQTNHVGIVDNSYYGDEDEWFIPCFSLRPGVIELYQRICQFRLMPTMNKMIPNLCFIEVANLDYPSRGGFGSTGKN